MSSMTTRRRFRSLSCRLNLIWTLLQSPFDLMAGCRRLDLHLFPGRIIYHESATGLGRASTKYFSLQIIVAYVFTDLDLIPGVLDWDMDSQLLPSLGTQTDKQAMFTTIRSLFKLRRTLAKGEESSILSSGLCFVEHFFFDVVQK